MITIERSDLGEELRKHLFAARNCSANRECCNQLAPLGNLCCALHHCTIVPTRLAKSIQEALALHESCVMNIQLVAQRSLGQNLQSDISHRMCVADDVTSTGKEQVEALIQLPSAADIERQHASRSSGRTEARSSPFCPACARE